MRINDPRLEQMLSRAEIASAFRNLGTDKEEFMLSVEKLAAAHNALALDSSGRMTPAFSKAVSTLAKLGLKPDGIEAFAYPSKPDWVAAPMIGGAYKIAKSLGIEMTSAPVYSNDDFQIDHFNPSNTRHISWASDRGELLGAWAQARRGDHVQVFFRPYSQLESSNKSGSKGGYSTAMGREAMAVKSAAHRVLRLSGGMVPGIQSVLSALDGEDEDGFEESADFDATPTPLEQAAVPIDDSIPEYTAEPALEPTPEPIPEPEPVQQQQPKPVARATTSRRRPPLDTAPQTAAPPADAGDAEDLPF